MTNTAPVTIKKVTPREIALEEQLNNIATYINSQPVDIRPGLLKMVVSSTDNMERSVNATNSLWTKVSEQVKEDEMLRYCKEILNHNDNKGMLLIKQMVEMPSGNPGRDDLIQHIRVRGELVRKYYNIKPETINKTGWKKWFGWLMP